jgi:hypothetical protein
MYTVSAGASQFQPLADRLGLALEAFAGEGTPIGDMLQLHREMVAMLQELEYVDRAWGCQVCMSCPHEADCRLAALIAKADGTTPPDSCNEKGHGLNPPDERLQRDV